MNLYENLFPIYHLKMDPFLLQTYLVIVLLRHQKDPHKAIESSSNVSKIVVEILVNILANIRFCYIPLKIKKI